MSSSERPSSADVTTKVPALASTEEPLGVGPEEPTVVDFELRRRRAKRLGDETDPAGTAEEDPASE
jgi:hypothetical protein